MKDRDPLLPLSTLKQNLAVNWSFSFTANVRSPFHIKKYYSHTGYKLLRFLEMNLFKNRPNQFCISLHTKSKMCYENEFQTQLTNSFFYKTESSRLMCQKHTSRNACEDLKTSSIVDALKLVLHRTWFGSRFGRFEVWFLGTN